MARIQQWLARHWQHMRADLLRMQRWARRAGPFYCGSALAHVLGVVVLLSWSMAKVEVTQNDMPDIVDTEIKEPEAPMFELVSPPVRLSELSTRSIALAEAPSMTEKKFGNEPVFEDAGGGRESASTQPALGGSGGFVATRVGGTPLPEDPTQGIGIGLGTSLFLGNGGGHEGFNGTGTGSRPQIDGATDYEETERSVAAALNWLRRHQHEDGSWSLSGYACHCRDNTCQGASDQQNGVLATSFALLTYLSAGQSHHSDGIYRGAIDRALHWLLANQSGDGGFGSGSPSDLATHQVATLAICECFAMTQDPQLAGAVQRAVWYNEQSMMLGMDGWRAAVCISAARRGLQVDAEALVAAQQWLVAQEILEDGSGDWTSQSVAWKPGEELAPVFEPLEPLVVTQEIVGSDEVIRCILSRGQAVSLDRRRQLLADQAYEGCATGSWPKLADANSLTLHQGRFPTTCLAAILLSASYRHLPIYRIQSPARVTRKLRENDTTKNNVDRRSHN